MPPSPAFARPPSGRLQIGTSKEPVKVPCVPNVTLYVPLTLVVLNWLIVMLPLVARTLTPEAHVDVVVTNWDAAPDVAVLLGATNLVGPGCHVAVLVGDHELEIVEVRE